MFLQVQISNSVFNMTKPLSFYTIYVSDAVSNLHLRSVLPSRRVNLIVSLVIAWYKLSDQTKCYLPNQCTIIASKHSCYTFRQPFSAIRIYLESFPTCRVISKKVPYVIWVKSCVFGLLRNSNWHWATCFHMRSLTIMDWQLQLN